MHMPLAMWSQKRDCWESLTDPIDLLSGRLVVFSETFPTSGSMRNGVAFEHPTSVPAITGSESSSSRGDVTLPTPKASDGVMGLPRTSGRAVEKATHLATRIAYDLP